MHPGGQLGAQRRAARQQGSRKQPKQGRMHADMLGEIEQANVIQQGLPRKKQSQSQNQQREAFQKTNGDRRLGGQSVFGVHRCKPDERQRRERKRHRGQMTTAPENGDRIDSDPYQGGNQGCGQAVPTLAIGHGLQLLHRAVLGNMLGQIAQ